MRPIGSLNADSRRKVSIVRLMRGVSTAMIYPSCVPPHIIAVLERYRLDHLRCGECLHRLLCGDVVGCAVRADADLLPVLGFLVRHLATEWGTPHEVQRHLHHTPITEDP